MMHWRSIVTATGSVGAIGASIRWWPRFWRGVARVIASPVLLEIQRETTLAREQQVADLLEIIEDQRRKQPTPSDPPPPAA